jgi:hypothetical protein
MFRDHPVVGVGPDCYAFNYFPYKIAAEAGHASLRHSLARQYNFGEAHNDHLQVLAENGLIGFLIWLGVLLTLSVTVVRQARRAEASDAAPFAVRFSRIVFAPLIAALVVLASASFPLHLTAPTLAFVTLFVICTTDFGRSPGSAEGNAFRQYAVGVITSAVALVFSFIYVWPRLHCNRITKVAEAATRSISERPDTYSTTLAARRNRALLEECLRRDPANVPTLMIAAANDQLAKNYDGAITLYRMALKEDRRPELYLNLGNCEIAAGLRDEGIADLVEAVAFEPSYIAAVEDVPARLAVERAARLKYPHVEALHWFYW